MSYPDTTKPKWILLIILVLAILAAGCTTSSPAPSPVVATPTPTARVTSATPGTTSASPTARATSNAPVTISGFSFQPAAVTIAQGGTVTWTNDDSTAHTVTFADGGSPQLQKGDVYSRQFNSTGQFDYHCNIHPSMTGRVTVV